MGRPTTIDLRLHLVDRVARNVLAQTRSGRADNVVMAGAHLDSVPKGPGINDNSRGVAVMLPLAERIKRQGHGTIVVLSSVAGERARKSNYVYGASKAGIDAFAQGLGDSLGGTGVHVMVGRPGFVRTKMTAGPTPCERRARRPHRASAPAGTRAPRLSLVLISFGTPIFISSSECSI